MSRQANETIDDVSPKHKTSRNKMKALSINEKTDKFISKKVKKNSNILYAHSKNKHHIKVEISPPKEKQDLNRARSDLQVYKD